MNPIVVFAFLSVISWLDVGLLLLFLHFPFHVGVFISIKFGKVSSFFKHNNHFCHNPHKKVKPLLISF